MNSRSRSLLLTAILATLGLLSSACNSYVDPLPPRDRLHFPISVAVHPSGDYLYVVNTNFDSRYKEAQGGTVATIDANSGAVLSSGTPYVASFGGLIQLNQTGTVAYVPTRFRSTVTLFHVEPDGRGLYCLKDGEKSMNSESCEIQQLPSVDGVKGPRIGESPYSVAVDTVFRKATVSGLSSPATLRLNTPTLPVSEISGDLPTLAAEASKLEGIEGVVDGGNLLLTSKDGNSIRVFPQGNQSVTYDASDAVYVSSMQARQISSILLPHQNLDEISMLNTPLETETGGIAKRPHSRDVVAVQRLGSSMLVFQPQFNGARNAFESMFVLGELPLNNRGLSIAGRGVAFNPKGDLAYIISGNPNALHMVRIFKSAVGSGYETGSVKEFYVVEKSVPLKNIPASIVYHETSAGSYLYIPCTQAKTIMVLDARTGAVVDEVFLGDTPSHFVVNEAKCRADVRECVGYVALFDDTPNGEDTCSTAAAGQCGSVGVVDLNPFSSTYHQIIRKFE